MKKIILAFMALAGLCACSSDDVLLSSSDDIATADKDAVYFKFDLSFADVTRSETNTDSGADYGTSTGGQEYGQTTENQVNSLTVALVDPETGNTIATEYVKNPDKIGTDTYVVSFEKKEITSYAGQDVNVYIYCNHEVEGFDENEAYNTAEVAPWTANQFYMSNAVSHSETLPATDEMNSHNTIANPIDLGVVRVERSVARFDYKDGANSTDGAYTYPITWDEEGGLIAKLVLSEVALINMSSNFYAFRHMAETDATSVAGSEKADLENVSILTTEMPDNWVIDTDAETKIDYNGEIGLTSTFTYLWDAPSTWEWAKLTDLTTDDNHETWNPNGSDGEYHIWRYATENTIPSIEAQQNGITTGVVFKAELVNTSTGGSVEFGGGTGGRVYVYENNLYASWEAVAEAAALEDENYSLHDAYREVMDVWTDPTTQTEYDTDVTEAMARAGFTGYSPDEDGKYYVYYYYWNQHNNNGQDGIMGIMEYAVVRNNVYKLSVTDITGFGHPTPPAGPDDPDYDPDDPDNPNPDPDPIDPNNPDETQDIYLKVDVEILPWVVRENDIKF